MSIGANKHFFFTLTGASTPVMGTTNFGPALEFGVRAKRLKLVAEGGDVTFSFNGTDTHGVLKVADGPQDFDECGASKLYAKGSGATLRVFAWQGED